MDDVNRKVLKGHTLGIVGESGCGKSTLGRLMLRLLEATEGQVLFEGRDLNSMDKHELRMTRREMQMIFQDPYSSLNPRMSVSELIAEPLISNKIYSSKAQLNARILELMDIVGLSRRLETSYPHELDGGRRQRIGVARALALNPKFIVCDEPVSALDVSIQAQVLNLLMDLQDEFNLTYVFITHDLSVVKHISDEIAVMYLGSCVEYAKTKDLFASPKHPYTRALLDAIPVAEANARKRDKHIITGEVTSPIEPKPGCRFAARCTQAREICVGRDVGLRDVGNDHHVACTLYQD